MCELKESQVIEAEEQLRLAMIASDVSVLDKLLSQELIFTNHLGQLVTKEQDLLSHKTGLVKVDELIPAEKSIHIHGEVAIVSVLVHLLGSYDGIPGAGDFRFTRVWIATSNDTLQVIAGHACVVA